MKNKSCEWSADRWGDLYDTTCGKEVVNVDDLSVKEFKYCPYCGKPTEFVQTPRSTIEKWAKDDAEYKRTNGNKKD